MRRWPEALKIGNVEFSKIHLLFQYIKKIKFLLLMDRLHNCDEAEFHSGTFSPHSLQSCMLQAISLRQICDELPGQDPFQQNQMHRAEQPPLRVTTPEAIGERMAPLWIPRSDRLR